MEHVHFKLCPTWFTQHVRDRWLEGSYREAFGLLESAFPDMEQEDRFNIIRGRLKLVDAGDNKMSLDDDNWHPNKDDCSWGRYPLPSIIRKLRIDTIGKYLKYLELRMPKSLVDRFNKNREEEEADIYEDDFNDREHYQSGCGLQRAIKKVADHGLGVTICSPNTDRQALANNMGCSILEPMDHSPKKPFGGFDSLEEMNQMYLIKRNMPTTEQFISDLMSREDRGKPKPDSKAELGWLSPKGELYPCMSAMEHIWLAEQLGGSEEDLEKKGWIKITKGMSGDRNIFEGQKKATQKQINAVFDWCEHWNHELPIWAGGK